MFSKPTFYRFKRMSEVFYMVVIGLQPHYPFYCFLICQSIKHPLPLANFPWITIMRICDQIFEGIPVQIVLKHLVVHNMSEIIIIHFMIDERFYQKCILTINIYSDLFIISINFYERREFSEYLFNWKWTKNGRFLQNNVKLHFIINFMH